MPYRGRKHGGGGSRVLLRVATALVLPLCLGFRPPSSVSNVLRQQSHRHYHDHAVYTASRTADVSASAVEVAATATRGAVQQPQLRAMRRGDLMEKIRPLIDELTVAREMEPSDLTQDYGSVVFPDPLTVGEVCTTLLLIVCWQCE